MIPSACKSKSQLGVNLCIPLLMAGISGRSAGCSVKSHIATVLSFPPVAYIVLSSKTPVADDRSMPLCAAHAPVSSKRELNFYKNVAFINIHINKKIVVRQHLPSQHQTNPRR